eukprot:SAG22_NODE_103_length_20175_cov_15.280833_14_plen_68_part_00
MSLLLTAFRCGSSTAAALDEETSAATKCKVGQNTAKKNKAKAEKEVAKASTQLETVSAQVRERCMQL